MTDLAKMNVRQRLRFLVRDTAIYGLGGALNRALALITFPLLARHFSVEDYGLIDLLNTSLMLLLVILIFGQDSAIARFFYDDENNERRRQVVSQSFFYQLAIVSIALPILWFAAEPVAALMIDKHNGAAILKLMLIQAPFLILINFSQALLKWTFKRWHFLFISVGSTIVTMIGLVISITIFKLDVIDVFIVYLVTRATFGLCGIWMVKKWLTWPNGLSQLRAMFPFAIPFGIVCVLAAIYPVMERLIVKSLIGPYDLGLFAAGAKVAAFISLPVSAFSIGWGPFALSIYQQPDAINTYRIILKVYVLGTLVFALVLAAMAEIVLLILGSARYSAGAIIVLPLAMGLAFQSMAGITEIGIIISKKSSLKIYSYITIMVVGSTSMAWLGWLFGLPGIAWASMIGLLSGLIVDTMLAQRVYPIEWNFRPLIWAGLLCVLTGVLHQWTGAQFAVLGISLVPLAGAICLLILGWFVIFDRSWRAKILQNLGIR